MRPLHALLLVIATLGLGLAAWILIENDELDARPAQALPHSAMAEESEARPQAAHALDGPAAQPSSEAPERAAIDRDGPQPTAAVRDEPQLSGRLVDSLGNAIAGAKVIRARGSLLFGDITHALEDERLNWLGRETTTSGADGRFAMDLPESSEVQLAAFQNGFVPLRETRTLKVGEDNDLGDLVLETSVFLSGRVVDTRGNGVAEAEIRAYPRLGDRERLHSMGQAGTLLATSAADGSFEVDQLASGPWRILIRSEEHPSKVEEGGTDRPGQRVDGLQFALEDGAEIAGRVIEIPAELGDSLQVRASYGGGPSGPDLTPFGTSFMVESRSAPVEADGSFRLRGLRREAKYKLTARLTEDGLFARSRSAAVQAESGDRGIEIPYRAETALIFQITDSASGRPIEECSVQAGAPWPMPLMDESGRKPLKLHPAGQVRFGGLSTSNSQVASLNLSAVGYENYTLSDIELIEGEEIDLGVIQLEPIPMVRVSVLDDASGKPVLGARVRLSEIQPTGSRQFEMSLMIDESGEAVGGDSSRRVRTDENGMALLSSLPGKRAQVSVEHDSFAPTKSDEIQLPPGKPYDLEVRLRRGGSVICEVVDKAGEPVSGATIEHRAPDEDGSVMRMPFGHGVERTDSQGRLVFEHLEQGEHSFRIGSSEGDSVWMAAGGADMEVDMVVTRAGNFGEPASEEEWETAYVSEGSEETLRLVGAPQATLEGRVTEGGAPLLGATLELSKDEGGSRPQMAAFGFGGADAKAKSRAGGNYAFENIEAGDYRLTVKHPNRVMPSEFELSLREGQNDFNVELSLASIEGRVTNTSGDPVAGARVSVERVVASGGPLVRTRMVMVMAEPGGEAIVSTSDGESPDAVYTDEDGRYALRGVATDVKLVVKAEASSAQPGKSKEVRVKPDQVRRNVDVLLAQGGSIEVHAIKADGKPAGMYLAEAEYGGPDEGPDEPQVQITGQDGKVTFEGMAPGKWVVKLRNLGGLGPDEEESDGSDEAGEELQGEVEVVIGETARLEISVP